MDSILGKTFLKNIKTKWSQIFQNIHKIYFNEIFIRSFYINLKEALFIYNDYSTNCDIYSFVTFHSFHISIHMEK